MSLKVTVDQDGAEGVSIPGSLSFKVLDTLYEVSPIAAVHPDIHQELHKSLDKNTAGTRHQLSMFLNYQVRKRRLDV